MSQVTRCPACLTMFRVVPDQLRISAGWVRCGKCAEVFEAIAHLQAVAAPARKPTPVSAQPKMPPAAATTQAAVGAATGKPPAFAAPVPTKSAAPAANAARVSPAVPTAPLPMYAPPAIPAVSARPTVEQQAESIAAPLSLAANLRANRLAVVSATASAAVPAAPRAPAPAVTSTPVAASAAAPGTAVSARIAAGVPDVQTAQSKVPARMPVQKYAQAPPQATAPPQQAKKAAAAHFSKDDYLGDLPELDSLLVIYPDEIEAFERELVCATPPGAKPAVSSMSGASPTASTAREWPPLDTPDFDATRISGEAGSSAASIKRPKKISRGNSAPMLLQASTSDASEEPSHSGPVDLSEPTPLPVTAPLRALNRMPKLERAAADMDPSFVRSAKRNAFWRRPSVRLGGGLVCLVLICALVFQWLVQERDRIAAASPAMRPLVYAACRMAGCTVAPQRQIESMVIDSSSFNKNRGDAYQLSLTLKNLSALELATPAIEVTLTDSQDQALIRRVVSPAELGIPAVMSARSERLATLPISISSGGGSARVSGYRLLAFYP